MADDDDEERRIRMPLLVAGREIPGHLACPPVSTEFDEDTGRRRSRWVFMELYVLDDGTWLAHRIGQSRVYHRRDTTCFTRSGRKSGEPAGRDELPEGAVPCPVCRPREVHNLPAGPGTVRFEFPRHSWDQCPTAALVKSKLTTVRSRDGSVSEFTSEPVAQLLRNAAAVHPEFATLLAA